MIKLGEIQSQTTIYSFIKDDIEGFEVKGNVTIDKDNNIINVKGDVVNNDTRVAGFNTWGTGDDIRFNTHDCKGDYLIKVSEILKSTIEDFKNTL